MSAKKTYYLVSEDAHVIRTTSEKNATDLAAAIGTPLHVATDEDLTLIPTPLLVKLFNRASPERQVARFADRGTAEKRLKGVLDLLAVAPSPETAALAAAAPKPASAGVRTRTRTGTPAPDTISLSQDENTTMAAKKKSARKAPSPTAKKRVRSSDNDTLVKVTADNPHREGGSNFEGWKLIRDGMKVSAFVEKGGLRALLSWWVAKGHLKIKKAAE